MDGAGNRRCAELNQPGTRQQPASHAEPAYGHDSASNRQRVGITDAYTALNVLPAGAAAISVLASLAGAAGIAPRISAYQ